MHTIRAEEERRAKATERVQRKLGVPLPPGVVAVAGAPAAAGSGGSGAVAGGGAAAVAAAVDGGRDSGGRPRRARQRVNYAFEDYDQTLRSGERVGGG